MVDAVGVDGCRAGWVAATVVDGRVAWTPYADFDAVLNDHRGAVIGVDIPIGLPDLPRGRRAADEAARRRLTGASGSVFSAPSREHLDAFRDHQPYRTGWNVQKQAWYLLPKISQVDHALTQDPTLIESVIEVHPEVSFRAIVTAVLAPPIDSPKSTALGLGQRQVALERAGYEMPAWIDAPRGVGVDDLLDAVAALWTAQRWGAGHEVLGDGSVDSHGLPMRIVV